MKAGFLAIMGLPNSGKSTLVNALVGDKVSIVTHKPQTTRKRVKGIVTKDDLQIIFLDAPGFVKDEKGLNNFIKSECDAIIKDCDAVLMLLDVGRETPAPLLKMIHILNAINKPKAALITKSDLSEERVSTIGAQLTINKIPHDFVSVLKNPTEATEKVLALVRDLLPESPAPLYDPDLYTTENVRDLVAELVREQCFEKLQQEIPYGLAIEIRLFEENPGLTRIFADIIVEKDNHKMVVIGNKGQMIKSIGEVARKNIEALVDSKVYLELHVVVKKKWYNNRQHMEALGYVTT